MEPIKQAWSWDGGSSSIQIQPPPSCCFLFSPLSVQSDLETRLSGMVIRNVIFTPQSSWSCHRVLCLSPSLNGNILIWGLGAQEELEVPRCLSGFQRHGSVFTSVSTLISQHPCQEAHNLQLQLLGINHLWPPRAPALRGAYPETHN